MPPGRPSLPSVPRGNLPPYVINNDVAYLPLHIVESFYVRLMRLAPGVRHDLTVMIDPSALAEVERVALEQGLDASPTTPTVYLQRLQALSMHLRDPQHERE